MVTRATTDARWSWLIMHISKLKLWTKRSHHFHSNFAMPMVTTGLYGKTLLRAHLCSRDLSPEFNASAVLRKSLHVKRQGYMKYYHFSVYSTTTFHNRTGWTLFLFPFLPQTSCTKCDLPQRVLVYNLFTFSITAQMQFFWIKSLFVLVMSSLCRLIQTLIGVLNNTIQKGLL